MLTFPALLGASAERLKRFLAKTEVNRRIGPGYKLQSVCLDFESGRLGQIYAAGAAGFSITLAELGVLASSHGIGSLAKWLRGKWLAYA